MSTQVMALASLRSRVTGADAPARTIVGSPRGVPTLDWSLSELAFRVVALVVASAALLIGTAPPSNAADPNGDGIPGPPGLPDRNYEMVSPPEKGNQDVLPAGALEFGDRSSGSGNSIIFTARGSFAGNPSSPLPAFYRSTRGATTWETTGISPPLSVALARATPLVHQLSADHSRAIVRSNFPLAPGAWTSERFSAEFPLYRRSVSSGHYELITTIPIDGSTPYSSTFVGGDRTLDSVLFETTAELTANAEPLDDGETKLYKWTNGSVALQSVLPDGTASAGSAGSALDSADELLETAISEDGSRVFFTAVGGPADGDLFVREGGTTTLIADGGEFRGATPNGRFVFFMQNGELRRHDVDLGITTTISVDHEVSDGSGVALGILGFSHDGSRVYFAGTGQFVAGGPPVPHEGLYLWEETGTSFVGAVSTVEGTPSAMWENTSALTARQTRYVTPNGAALLFASTEPLTEYDNSSPACEDGACQELFLYRKAESGPLTPNLVCVSCNPSGDPPTGDVGQLGNATLEPGSRHLSSDGQMAFFTSPDPLVESDTNQRRDAYVWESGHVSLVSSGRDVGNSYFAEASPSGDSIFFTTTERLVDADIDSAQDLYDARVGGGLPRQPDAHAPCTGDECQGSASLPPSEFSLGSATFAGPGHGNVEPANHCDRLLKMALRKLEKAQKSSGKKAMTLRTQAKKLKRKARECGQELRS